MSRARAAKIRNLKSKIVAERPFRSDNKSCYRNCGNKHAQIRILIASVHLLCHNEQSALPYIKYPDPYLTSDISEFWISAISLSEGG